MRSDGCACGGQPVPRGGCLQERDEVPAPGYTQLGDVGFFALLERMAAEKREAEGNARKRRAILIYLNFLF